MLNPKQTAIMLYMSVPTLEKMRDAGLLPKHSYLTPGRCVWRKEDIELFADCWPRNMEEYNRRLNTL